MFVYVFVLHLNTAEFLCLFFFFFAVISLTSLAEIQLLLISSGSPMRMILFVVVLYLRDKAWLPRGQTAHVAHLCVP